MYIKVCMQYNSDSPHQQYVASPNNYKRLLHISLAYIGRERERERERENSEQQRRTLLLRVRSESQSDLCFYHHIEMDFLIWFFLPPLFLSFIFDFRQLNIV